MTNGICMCANQEDRELATVMLTMALEELTIMEDADLAREVRQLLLELQGLRGQVDVD